MRRVLLGTVDGDAWDLAGDVLRLLWLLSVPFYDMVVPFAEISLHSWTQLTEYRHWKWNMGLEKKLRVPTVWK